MSQGQLSNQEQFFYANAGYSYNPAKETKEEGKVKNAKGLALSESKGRDISLSFEWVTDTEEENLWGCICRNEEGEIVSSLWGIDFGADNTPWGDPYRRVVEAELAWEVLF